MVYQTGHSIFTKRTLLKLTQETLARYPIVPETLLFLKNQREHVELSRHVWAPHGHGVWPSSKRSGNLGTQSELAMKDARILRIHMDLYMMIYLCFYFAGLDSGTFTPIYKGFITNYLGFIDHCNPPKTLPWIVAFHQDSLKSSLDLCHRSHVFGILGSPWRLIFRGFPLDISRKYHRLAFTFWGNTLFEKKWGLLYKDFFLDCLYILYTLICRAM